MRRLETLLTRLGYDFVEEKEGLTITPKPEKEIGENAPLYLFVPKKEIENTSLLVLLPRIEWFFDH